MRKTVFRPRVAFSGLFLLFAVLWLFFASAPSPAHSAIYTWRDSQGVLHISETPPEQSGGSAANAPVKGRPFVPPPVPDSESDSKQNKTPKSWKPVEGTGKLFFWSVRSPSTSGYLLGTIHFGDQDMYPLDLRIENGFEQSTVVAVEANPYELSPKVSMLVQTLGTYTQGDSLLRHISAKTADMLREKGVNLDVFSKLRPWLLALQLEVDAYRAQGFEGEFGVDFHFLGQLGSRRLVELESVESQIRMLSKLPEGDEDAYLQKTIKSLAKIKNIFPEIIELWSAGDVEGLERLALHSTEELALDERTYNLMIRDRNKVMAAGITDLLKGNEPFFVMVGALHLVGPDGVPALLAKQGFKVAQIGTGAQTGQFSPYRPTVPAGTGLAYARLQEPSPSRRCAVR